VKPMEPMEPMKPMKPMEPMEPMWTAAAVILVVLSAHGPATAQDATPGRLTVVVADQTGAVIPAATVRVMAESEAGVVATVASQQTSAEGEATFTELPPGVYVVETAFPGFDTTTLREVRVSTDERRQRVVLPIARVEDTVTVAEDPQSAASDRRGPAFGTVLTREQIDLLSDDPEEMRRQLQEMAGPDAVILVDSFEGAPLPSKSQIRMIRISRDAFAAEHHRAGGIQIDIVTQPGIGPFRINFGTQLRPGSLTGRSPFVARKGPERTQQYTVNVGGSLVPERTSVNLTVGGTAAFQTPNLNVALLSGTRSEALALRQPRDQVSINANLDHALTPDQTLRVGFNRSTTATENQGIGDYDLPERAYGTDTTSYALRAQHIGPLGRRFFTSTRVQVNWSDSATFSALEAPTIRVLDAFTSGGQQRAGGTRSRTVSLASDLDYVRGIHSWRTGIDLDGTWYHSDATSNYLGTYTFESLAAFEANQPRSYTRRLGDPTLDYVNLEGGLYIQDDVRLRRNLTVSPGLRYELQTHVADYDNLGPRVGVTWSPDTGGQMSLRGSAGVFYDWLGTGIYEQTLRVDGNRQRELDVADPSFPDPGDVGVVPPVNRYLLDDGVRLPRQMRVSAGIDRAITRQSRIGVTWAQLWGTALSRGQNLNAPVEGVRPAPAFGNIIQVVSDARARENQLTVFFNVSLNRPRPSPGGGPRVEGASDAPPAALAAFLPAAQTDPLVDWRRLSMSGQYAGRWLRNNTDGAFSVPPTGSLDAEWGVGAGEIRHRLFLTVSAQTLRRLTTSLNAQLSSGAPYTLQTGFDDNQDLIFNDRPAGVPRNTERARGQLALNLNVNYAFTFGRPRADTPPPTGIFVTNVGGVVSAGTVAVPQNGRYRVSVFVRVQNLTNRANFVGYSGTLTSPFFGRPRDVSNPRRVDVGINFGF